MTKTFVEQKKYQEAEKALWESYDGLRSNGIRGQTGLSWLESITEQLRALYNIWKSPESSSGAKRLKALDESSSHGE